MYNKKKKKKKKKKIGLFDRLREMGETFHLLTAPQRRLQKRRWKEE